MQGFVLVAGLCVITSTVAWGPLFRGSMILFSASLKTRL
jgi:hypothetical protein